MTKPRKTAAALSRRAAALMVLDDPTPDLDVARAAIRAGLTRGDVGEALRLARIVESHLGPAAVALHDEPEPEFTLELLTAAEAALHRTLAAVKAELAHRGVVAGRRAA
jgi:glutathione S-transferase